MFCVLNMLGIWSYVFVGNLICVYVEKNVLSFDLGDVKKNFCWCIMGCLCYW